tara:strand:- start:300 stop:482 length:183 start_codon:yes stop_codon:yes gene_type:complete
MGTENNNSLKLVRTDSTTIKSYSENNKINTILTPLGRIRRINRLNKEFIKEYNNLYKNNK